MHRQAFIKKVALKMDEISSSDDVIVSVGIDDNNPLYTQINSLLDESVNDVLMKAPIYRIPDIFKNHSTPKEYIITNNRQIAVFSVPDDFIRLVSISSDLFKRPVVELAIEGDYISKRQHNVFLMAKSAKPVAVIGHSLSGERIISCYSFDADESPQATMSYIHRFDGDFADVDEYLAEVVTWACAGKVFAAQGDTVKGKTCDENAVALMA
jgi:hypothetical protein